MKKYIKLNYNIILYHLIYMAFLSYGLELPQFKLNRKISNFWHLLEFCENSDPYTRYETVFLIVTY